MKRLLFSILIIIAVGVVVLVVWAYRGRFPLPAGETTVERIVLPDGTRELMITGGVKHSVPLADIRAGGPPKDGIPPIDNPKFVGAEEASAWLEDGEPGVAFSRGSTHRFYPYQILVWHELVNDTVEGERVLVTYCPLCLTGIVFDPLVGGERVEFGTSGRLWQSNLVMYDRKTDSLWSQVLGESILGEMTSTKLAVLPSDQVLFGNWKELYKNGEVLSRDTGTVRLYGTNPYGGYFNVTGFAYALAKRHDERIARDAFVFGVEVDGKTKAYYVDAVKAAREVVDEFAGETFVLRHDPELDVVRMYRRLPDGSEERVNPFSAFWFSWVAAHPDTELYL